MAVSPISPALSLLGLINLVLGYTKLCLMDKVGVSHQHSLFLLQW